MADATGDLRWLIVHQNSELYGADRIVAEVVSALGPDAAVTVVLPGDGPLVAELADRGAEVEIDPTLFVLRKSALHPRAIPGTVAGVVRSVWRLRRRMRDVDAVYVNTITLPSAVLAARLARRPLTVHVHEAETQSARPVQKILLATLLPARRVIAISELVRQFVVSNWPRLATRTVVVRNPVRQPAIAFEVLPDRRPERLVVITPGRWSPRKGTDLAVAAVAGARARGVPADLILLGGVFAGYEWFETQVREQAAHEVPDARFVPFTADPDGIWRETHVTLMPSRMEPYGLVAAESMARGRVTVVSDVEGLAEIVDDESVGWAVAPEADALAAALAQVWQDWDDARGRALAGRDAASAWTTDAFAEAIRAAVAT